MRRCRLVTLCYWKLGLGNVGALGASPGWKKMATDEDYDGPGRSCSCSCSGHDHPRGRSRPGPICRLPLWPQCKTRRDREATPEGDSSRRLVRVGGSNRLLADLSYTVREMRPALNDLIEWLSCTSLRLAIVACHYGILPAVGRRKEMRVQEIGS